MKNPLRIASRKSPLALWQANYVRNLLLGKNPEQTIEIDTYTTEGDRRLGQRLSSIGGKGLFIKELERIIVEGRADIAVHSMKDVPSELNGGCSLKIVGDRADVRDALVGATSLMGLSRDARIGSSSPRRAAQLLQHNPDFQISPVRGNVQTRLAILDEGNVDALVLAAAGLDRLGLSNRIGQRMDTKLSLPAAGQGALGVEYLTNRDDLTDLLTAIEMDSVALSVRAERQVVLGVSGDCTLPLGVLCQPIEDKYQLEAVLFSKDGSQVLRVQEIDSDAASLGKRVTQQLINLGAKKRVQEHSLER